MDQMCEQVPTVGTDAFFQANTAVKHSMNMGKALLGGLAK